MQDNTNKKEDEHLIEGRNAVLEAFRSGKTVDKLYIQDGLRDGVISSILRDAKKKDVIVNFVAKEKLDMMSTDKKHQGVMAICSAYEYADIEDIFAKAEEKGEDFQKDFTKECWIPVLIKEIPLKVHVHRVDDIFTAIRIAKEFGLGLTLDHCTEGHLVAEKIAESGYPAIVGPSLTSRSKKECSALDFKTSGILQKAGVNS